ncbi:hypothetical protein WH390_08470 [Candidatus Arsenophonus nilaparvatae]|uniref:hypothetical protein n=1 Tax=Candidatus Arsenophonus nilaparvatae TaxID=1247023 RepID=UPI000509F479|nr:hypothetical protein [Candidatus Arsenophonus nilaparvatae]
MSESLVIRIKNSFSFNKPVITEHNCQQNFKKELIDCLKAIANNSKNSIKISKTFELSAKQYCSLSAEGLEVLLDRKYDGLLEINKANLQKFGFCLFECIKEIKNSDKLDNIRRQIGGNIIDTIGLRFLIENENDQDFNYVNECSNKICDIKNEDKRIKEIMQCFDNFIDISYRNEQANENKMKLKESILTEKMTELVEEKSELAPSSSSVEKKSVIEKDEAVLFGKIGVQVKESQGAEKRIQAKSQQESKPTFWQKLSQKTSQLFATSWSFIKTKLIGFLLPTFFSTKIN